MLEDKFGRRFEYLRLSVTDVCNFRCNYCLPQGYQGQGQKDFLSVKELGTVVAAFAGLGTRKVRLTGGEPSLRKDLAEIIATCRATPGIEQVALTTNGFKLPQQVDAWIEAGLGAINVSIDSLDPRQFLAITGHDKLDTVLRGVFRALEHGIKVKINSVMLRQYSDVMLEQAIRWLKHTPVSLRLIELMQTGDNRAFFEAQHMRGASIKQRLLEQGWLPVLRDRAAGPAEEFAHPDHAGRIGLIMPYSKDFCVTCNRLRVSATGNLHLCLFAEKGIPLRDDIQTGDVQALQHRLENLIGQKQASHWLDQGFTGATTHLAMLGG